MSRVHPDTGIRASGVRKTTNTKTLWKTVVEELKQSGPKTRESEEFKNVKFVFFPDDTFIEYWGVVVAMLLFYTCTVTPYRICLVDIDTPTWMYIDLAIDLLFFVDFTINSLQAYYDNKMNIVVSHKKILCNYAKGWMVIDFLSCFPLEFTLESQKNYSNLLRFGRVTKLYKLAKIFKLIRILKLVRDKNKIMRYMTSVFRVDIAIERLIWFLITFLLLVHLLACLWIFIGRFEIYASDQNWIYRGQMLDFEDARLYLAGIYWATTTLTTVGYGDIVAYNSAERIFACFSMIIGIFLYSYIIGSLTNLLSNLDQREAKLTRKLDIVNRLHREYPTINKEFYKKITTALEYKHKNTKSNIDSLLSDLPLTLRSKLLIVIYQKELQSNVFFENKKTDFVAFLAPLLKPVRIEAGDYVFKTGELASEMYFIISGEVNMTTIILVQSTDDVPEHQEEIPFKTILAEYFFGETDLLFSENRERTYNVKASLKSELLALSKEGFESMLKNFEEESTEIMNMAYNRNIRIKESLNHAIDIYNNNKIIMRNLSFPHLIPNTEASSLQTARINIIPPEAEGTTDVSKTKNMYDVIIEEKLGKVESDIVWTKKKLRDLTENITEAKDVLTRVCENLV